jgi:hypothetical protein
MKQPLILLLVFLYFSNEIESYEDSEPTLKWINSICVAIEIDPNSIDREHVEFFILTLLPTFCWALLEKK